MSTLQERFSLAIKHYEKTSGKRFVKAHLADYCGVSRPAVSEWIDKNVQTLEQDNAEKAARFLGVNHRWLNGLSPSMLEDATPPNNSTPDIPHRPVIAWEAPEDLDPNTYVIIPHVDVKFSAGNSIKKNINYCYLINFKKINCRNRLDVNNPPQRWVFFCLLKHK